MVHRAKARSNQGEGRGLRGFRPYYVMTLEARLRTVARDKIKKAIKREGGKLSLIPAKEISKTAEMLLLIRQDDIINAVSQLLDKEYK